MGRKKEKKKWASCWVGLMGKKRKGRERDFGLENGPAEEKEKEKDRGKELGWAERRYGEREVLHF